MSLGKFFGSSNTITEKGGESGETVTGKTTALAATNKDWNQRNYNKPW